MFGRAKERPFSEVSYVKTHFSKPLDNLEKSQKIVVAALESPQVDLSKLDMPITLISSPLHTLEVNKQRTCT